MTVPKKANENIPDLENKNNEAKEIKMSNLKLETKGAQDIYYAALGKMEYFIEGLIPQGLNIICGASKTGKSWLVLWWCLQICAGANIWDKKTSRSDCLYLCLEDNERRIQNRLHTLTDEPPENLRFAFLASKTNAGLTNQLDDHLQNYPKTKFIVIDTFQKIRGKNKNGDTQYASDYDDLGGIKSFADERNICILLVHHTRKQTDENDPFNEINGTNGITGTVDNMYVLKKDERFSDKAKLYTTGRDISQERISIEFIDAVWQFIESDNNKSIETEKIPSFVFSVRDYVLKQGQFVGTITELLEQLNEQSVPSNKASKYLSKHYSDVFEPSDISMDSARQARGRVFILTHKSSVDSVGKITGKSSTLPTLKKIS